ncbi:hypothetical protein GA0070616_4632 [Micromonospora nigra]|uniref:Uncharacterized protein n=1 Tax=Micromonospora nigra TaxID=145857 RepID=A0A1C6SU95_9ACTN|nr:hypothetical protein [Micromonospora nigra]SCL33090.1 hypothetical protein GA0070616_4632 [Micromonospora nigra]
MTAPRPGPTRRQTIAPGVYRLTRSASPQFVVPITVRIFKQLLDRFPPWGWEWVECYQLDHWGVATARRTLFVRTAGLEAIPDPAVRRTAPVRRAPVRRGPVVADA